MPTMSQPSRSRRSISAADSSRGPCVAAYVPPSAASIPARLRGVEQSGAQAFAIRRCEIDVHHVTRIALEERMLPTPGVVDNLIGNHDGAVVETGSDSPDRCDGDGPSYPCVMQCPDIGAVVDPMGSDDVRHTMACKEHDVDISQPAVAQRRRGLAPGRVDAHPTHDLQSIELRQTRPPDDREVRHEVLSA